ncbi:hypothetical protein DR64_8428 [Paraburkholderia xenovorans LB400]|nr:hypothetical protein DR64_8428 [Paraburkholderia xenovorans LB400]
MSRINDVWEYVYMSCDSARACFCRRARVGLPTTLAYPRVGTTKNSLYLAVYYATTKPAMFCGFCIWGETLSLVSIVGIISIVGSSIAVAVREEPPEGPAV